MFTKFAYIVKEIATITCAYTHTHMHAYTNAHMHKQ